ncbi:hypothetical protein DFA_08221 [Cavenderia fasciculata]|uniref:GPI ethanolamine phosphate transferase 3 n=1 Tax=Cavenderia fasciculata TaxID=261658 RepID=F4Q5H2_CACFS|nr:uncharacterized protein DFA_08221 [Cavenderia fasciculata]EGG17231.1 hypothetical protein DFA_08221 [Cavenderia fasciculata]|eukprot:XP_004355715.1 hypothetical protein DFA_08221 [Cavenderia fasciculata]
MEAINVDVDDQAIICQEGEESDHDDDKDDSRSVANNRLFYQYSQYLMSMYRQIGFFLMRFELPLYSQCDVLPFAREDTRHTTPLLSEYTKPSEWKWNHNDPSQDSVKSKSSCWMPSRFNRSILLFVDALRYDFVAPVNTTTTATTKSNRIMTNNQLKHIQHLLVTQPHNTLLYRFYADPPTVTSQRIKGITTGSLPTFIDIGSNFNSPAVAEDNLIRQLTDTIRKKRTVFVGDDTWTNMYPKMFYKSYPFSSFFVHDLDTVDFGVMDQTNKMLSPLKQSNTKPFDPREIQEVDLDRGNRQHRSPSKEKRRQKRQHTRSSSAEESIVDNDWDIIIGHLLGVDHVGHSHGPYNPSMKLKLNQFNLYFKDIIERMDNDTLLVIMGDHGMTNQGTHSGSSKEETDAALFFYAKNQVINASIPYNLFNHDPKATVDRKVDQIDFISTYSLLMGVPIGYNSLGKAIPELFISTSKTLPNGQVRVEKSWPTLLDATRLSTWSIKRYVDSYRQAVPSSELAANSETLTKFYGILDDADQRYSRVSSSIQSNQPVSEFEYIKMKKKKKKKKKEIISYSMIAIYSSCFHYYFGESKQQSFGFILLGHLVIWTNIGLIITICQNWFNTINIQQYKRIKIGRLKEQTRTVAMTIGLVLVFFLATYPPFQLINDSFLKMQNIESYYDFIYTQIKKVIGIPVGLLSILSLLPTPIYNRVLKKEIAKQIVWFVLLFGSICLSSREYINLYKGWLYNIESINESNLFTFDSILKLSFNNFITWCWTIPSLYFIFNNIYNQNNQNNNNKLKYSTCLLCLTIYWILDSIKHLNDVQPNWIIKSFPVWIIYSITIYSIIKIIINNNNYNSNNNCNNDNLFLNQYLKIIIPMIILLCTLLGPRNVVGFVWMLVQYIIIAKIMINIKKDWIKNNNNNNNGQMKLIYSIFQTTHWIVTITTLFYLSLFHFHSTGHEYGLGSLQLDCAFIGFQGLNQIRAAFMILLNTFSSTIIYFLSIPIFIIIFNNNSNNNGRLEFKKHLMILFLMVLFWYQLNMKKTQCTVLTPTTTHQQHRTEREDRIVKEETSFVKSNLEHRDLQHNRDT